jgi:hypothetical protein
VGIEPTLTKALAAPSLSLGHTAALALDLSTDTVVFAHNASLPVAPASNEKVPVSWAALTRLGIGYRFHTEVYGVGTRSGPTWNGDLVLKGFGDPTLSTPDMNRLAATISGRGIRAVSGRVLGDESFYDLKRGAAGWKRYFVGVETPPLSALVVDRAQGWPALSPPLLAARAFRDALARRGISVGGRPGLGLAPEAAVSLGPSGPDHSANESPERQLLRGDAAQAARRGNGQSGNVDRRRQARRRNNA